jgi:mannose-6-phosphate isomerase-like protein (cupin superfamily)
MSEIFISHCSDVTPIVIDQSMTLWPLLSSSQSPDLDFVWTRINGIHSRRVNYRSIKLYYVNSGNVVIRGDTVSFEVSAGGIALVPPGIWCEIEGDAAEVGIACCPAFDPKDEEVS